MFLSNIMSCNSVLYKLFSKPFWKKEVLRLERTFLCSIIQMYIYLTIKCLNQWKYKVSMLCIPKIEKIYTNCVYLPNMQNFWFRAPFTTISLTNTDWTTWSSNGIHNRRYFVTFLIVLNLIWAIKYRIKMIDHLSGSPILII